MLTAENKVVVTLGHDCVHIAMRTGPVYHVHNYEDFAKAMAEVYRYLGDDAQFVYSSSVLAPGNHTTSQALINLCEVIVQ